MDSGTARTIQSEEPQSTRILTGPRSLQELANNILAPCSPGGWKVQKPPPSAGSNAAFVLGTSGTIPDQQQSFMAHSSGKNHHGTHGYLPRLPEIKLQSLIFSIVPEYPNRTGSSAFSTCATSHNPRSFSCSDRTTTG